MEPPDPIPSASLRHRTYSPRQCALIHVEQTLDHNLHTLGLIGKADVVEFEPDGRPYPVEYKHGSRHKRAAIAACAFRCTTRVLRRAARDLAASIGALPGAANLDAVRSVEVRLHAPIAAARAAVSRRAARTCCTASTTATSPGRNASRNCAASGNLCATQPGHKIWKAWISAKRPRRSPRCNACSVLSRCKTCGRAGMARDDRSSGTPGSRDAAVRRRPDAGRVRVAGITPDRSASRRPSCRSGSAPRSRGGTARASCPGPRTPPPASAACSWAGGSW